MSGSITDVAGILVGHAHDVEVRTGCTVLIGPFRGACDVRGAATGTRELGTLSPLHLVPRVDAILLTGGSAHGLAAADGVVAWLHERGRGYDTGVAPVPIVPAAVIFDLGVGRPGWPDAAMGRAACQAAGAEVAEGRVGAGTGATVGKLLGPDAAVPGGVGTWSERREWTVGALAVVNALGDVRDAAGAIVAGARDGDAFADGEARLLAGTASAGLDEHAPPGTNTTLAVVATDAPLDRTALRLLARAAGVALARRITPAHTPFDGDVTFALSTSEAPEPAVPRDIMALSALAVYALGQAIERAVTAGVAGA